MEGLVSKLISVCIPTYNEENNVVEAVESVEKLFAEQLPQYDLELIITDNASVDSTWKIIKELAESRQHLKAVRFSRNFGYQNSIFAGLSLSTGDAQQHDRFGKVDLIHVAHAFFQNHATCVVSG